VLTAGGYALLVTIVALVFALIGTSLSILGIGWQIASWVLNGRRIKVKMLHGLAGRGGFATMKSETSLSSGVSKLAVMRKQGFKGPEVLGIEVINVGRIPVTGYAVACDGGFSYSPIGQVLGKPLPCRIEPGETETWYTEAADARTLVSSLPAIGRTASRIWMTAKLGTGQVKRTRAIDAR
jgi:hypothetical protein